MSRIETPTDRLPGNSWGILGNYRDYCDSNILEVLETVTKTVIYNLDYSKNPYNYADAEG
jgi:hypothetical protein